MVDDRGQELSPSQAPEEPVLSQPQGEVPGATSAKLPPIEKGSQPDAETIAASRELWEKVAQKRGRPLSEEENALMEQGKGPIGGGAAVTEEEVEPEVRVNWEEARANLAGIILRTEQNELAAKLQRWSELPEDRFKLEFSDLEFLKEQRKAIRDDREKGAIPWTDAMPAVTFLEKLIAAEERKLEASHARGQIRAQRGSPEANFTKVQIEAIIGDEKKREEIFENLFAKADGNPAREFRDAFSFYYDEPVYLAFLEVLRKEANNPKRPREERVEFEEANTRYAMEKEIRESLHNANYVLLANQPTEILVKFVQQFRPEMADIAFRKTGVVTAYHMHEQALRQVMEAHGGYLPYEEVAWDPRSGIGTGRVEQLTRKYLERAIDKGLVKNEAGESVRLEEWEIKRAIALARGLGVMTLGTLEIAAQSKLPPGKLGSLYAQDIIRDITPFIHLISKFGIGKQREAVLGFFLEGKKGPWTQKELLEFLEKADDEEELFKMLNEGDRFLSVLNPLKFGSIFGGWRIGDKEISAIFDLRGEDRKCAGIGVWIEKLRGDLSEKNKTKPVDEKLLSTYPDEEKRFFEEKDPETDKNYTKYGRAKTLIREQLNRAANMQPLMLYHNLEELRNYAAQQMPGLTPEAKTDVMADLVFLQEKAVQERLETLPFEEIEDPGRREQVRQFTKAIWDKFLGNGGRMRDEFIKTLETKGYKVPFILGTTDVMVDRWRFIRNGGNSFARKFRDFLEASKAGAATINIDRKMDSYQKQEDIVKDLREGYETISRYDEDAAREFALRFGEGIIKFYAKDWQARLPFGIGSLVEFIGDRGLLPNHRKASYAKTAFGKEAPAWDEEAKRRFTRALHAAGMLTYEQLAELEKRVGATIWHDAWCKSRRLGPFSILVLLFSMASEFGKDLGK